MQPRTFCVSVSVRSCACYTREAALLCTKTPWMYRSTASQIAGSCHGRLWWLCVITPVIPDSSPVFLRARTVLAVLIVGVVRFTSANGWALLMRFGAIKATCCRTSLTQCLRAVRQCTLAFTQ